MLADETRVRTVGAAEQFDASDIYTRGLIDVRVPRRWVPYQNGCNLNLRCIEDADGVARETVRIYGRASTTNVNVGQAPDLDKCVLWASC